MAVTAFPTLTCCGPPWAAKGRATPFSTPLTCWSWTAPMCDACHGSNAATCWLQDCEPGILLSEHLDGADGTQVFQHACKLGLEGIVAKRRDRPYRSGRCADWIKVKNPQAPAATRLIET